MNTPKVSIVIPACNKWELTRSCIESIYRYTPSSLFEIVVMDNGSTDATNRIPALFPSVIYLKEEHPVGFARANNLAAGKTNGELVCLLNNDTLVTPNWLEPLVETLVSRQSVVAVGPKLLYPNGKVQGAGIVFSYTRLPYHYGRFLEGEHPAVNIPAEFNCLTGACILCRKERYLEDGGFDERFVNGFEDVDLCLRWRRKGYGICYEPQSVVTHLETQTARTSDHNRENGLLYAHRWMNSVVQDDLDCYARMRTPHPDLDEFALVITSDGNTELLHKAIRIAFSFSRSVLAVLVLYGAAEDPAAMALPKSPVIDTVCSSDGAAIAAWVASQAGRPRFRGIVRMNRPITLPQDWDSHLEPFFEKRERAWLIEPDMYFESCKCILPEARS